jgi:hypothetical protein
LLNSLISQKIGVKSRRMAGLNEKIAHSGMEINF